MPPARVSAMSEFWFNKSVAVVGLTENGDSLEDVRARDLFSFWAPLDEQFVKVMGKMANAKHFDYMSAFGWYVWFSLIDYNSLSSPPVYPAASTTQNTTIDSQIMNMQYQLLKQALASQQFSPTGKAYQSVIMSAPGR